MPLHSRQPKFATHQKILMTLCTAITITLSGCAYMQTGNIPSYPVEANYQRVAPAYAKSISTLHKPGVNGEVNREKYGDPEQQRLLSAVAAPVSTFSIDVDTGSYTNVRRILNEGRLPPKGAVRAEEMINYFQYQDPAPRENDQPFRITTEVSTTPWNSKTQLLRIGIKGYEVPLDKRPAANLVFLVDVSGSMDSPNKLPLVQASLKLLTKQLKSEDRVSMVVYAGSSGVVLEPTSGDQHARIMAAISQLEAGGGTHGSSGIKLAYEMARQGFIKGGINRVLLATDGDFNVGVVDHDQLIDIIEQNRDKGVELSTLGYGTNNYQEQLMEQAADHGNGNYAYIDNLNEARRVLVEQLSGTLQTIAKDVKIQVEFNPEKVAEYRLIGYENRMLAREDFSNDRVDAGEIGSGHSLAALYEIALKGSGGERLEPLRYQESKATIAAHGDELAFVRMRYKKPGTEKSLLMEQAVTQENTSASVDMQLTAAASAFAQKLRGGTYLESFTYDDIVALAEQTLKSDNRGYRGEFLQLVKLAKSL